MALNTGIQWCDDTVNFWWGCTKVSAGCQHCYADGLSTRFGKRIWGADAPREIRVDAAIKELRKAERLARKEGRKRLVFSNSMSDFFENRRDLDVTRWVAFEAMERGIFPNLIHLLLTKRPEAVTRLVPPGWLKNWPENVWIGTSVEDQKTADERIPHLLQIPAAVRFLSMEPLLGPVDIDCAMYGPGPRHGLSCFGFTDGVGFDTRIHWVIVGGESGPKARPMHPDWARGLRDECVAAGVPFFFKQWGEFRPYHNMWDDVPPGNPKAMVWLSRSGDVYGGNIRPAEDYRLMDRIGKKRTGRLLDGREWSEFPGGRSAP